MNNDKISKVRLHFWCVCSCQRARYASFYNIGFPRSLSIKTSATLWIPRSAVLICNSSISLIESEIPYRLSMDSLERFMRAAPLPPSLPLSQGHRRALVHASLASAVGRKGRHMTGTFCLTGDTMEGIIQCLVFLKAFSVSQLKIKAFFELCLEFFFFFQENVSFKQCNNFNILSHFR